MVSEKNLKLEVDSKTIQVIGGICEISGLELPEVITAEFLETTSKRIKDIIFSLRKQTNQNSAQAEEYKNQVEKLQKQAEKLQKQVEDLKKANEQSKQTDTAKDETATTKTSVQKEETTDKTDKAEISEATRVLPSDIKNILIIANLGVIMHQLKILFAKFGCKVTLVKSYPEAIGELKENAYECILVDISTLNENEIMVVEALRKATKICHTDSLIVVLVVPTKEKALLKKLKEKGADIIVEKGESWHMNIIKELKLVS